MRNTLNQLDLIDIYVTFQLQQYIHYFKAHVVC